MVKKRNRINYEYENESFVSLIGNPNQLITLDANFFISPDRSEVGRGTRTTSPMPFDFFKEVWINELFEQFKNIAIHSAVYDEIAVSSSSKKLVDFMIKSIPPQIQILYDKDLSPNESIIRNTLEVFIPSSTNYNPDIDNSTDKGEVKTLAYIGAKGILYFCSHDANAISLIEDTEKLDTKLDGLRAIHTYELIYYISKFSTNKKLKHLYKYMYYLSETDRSVNPEWGEFKINMDNLYSKYFQQNLL
ncbi:MAG: hypothetical protein ACERKV_01055 [Clostridiaceae bacterium]